MVGIRILGDMAGGVQQFHLYLKGGVGELAQQLRLGHDFSGHQVENQEIQRTDILVNGPVLGHDKDVFALQGGSGGQGIGDFDGHNSFPTYI